MNRSTPGLVAVFLLVIKTLCASQAGTGTIVVDNDSAKVIIVPDLHIKVILLGDSTEDSYFDCSDDSNLIAGNVAFCRIAAGKNRASLNTITISTFESVDTFAKKVIDRGELPLWSVGDSRGLETGDHYLKEKQNFLSRTVSGYCNDYITLNGRTFANERNYDGYGGGVFYNVSTTFIDNTRIKISMYASADSLFNTIEKKVSDSIKSHSLKSIESEDTSGNAKNTRVMMAQRRDSSEVSFDPVARAYRIVSDSLKPDYLTLLRKFRIETYSSK